MPIAPHEFWQEIFPPHSFSADAKGQYRDFFPATLPDGRQFLLPIRVLPGGSGRAVASLIVNQASFAVEDALAEAMTATLRPLSPDVVVGVPTLGLSLANAVARRLGHARMVALGTSRKFWYDERLSEPMSSITSPGHERTLFLDPRMLPLLGGRRVVLVDDVISTGRSTLAAVRLLEKAGIRPVALCYAMAQTDRWRTSLAEHERHLPELVHAAVTTPLLAAGTDDAWQPVCDE